MDISESKKREAKALDISLEICQNSMNAGVAYGEKLDFHSAIREFTTVIEFFPKLVELTTNLNLPPKVLQEGTIAIVDLTCRAYLGRAVAYMKIGEKEKGNDDMVMAEKVKNILKPDFEHTRIDSGIRIDKYTGSATSVNIPSRIDGLPVTTIGDWAFQSCESMKSIQIPNSVTSIGNWAFFNCASLTSIQIPSSVTTIGERAFADCASLKSVHISNPNTVIDKGAFNGCHRALSISREPIIERVIKRAAEVPKITSTSYGNSKEKVDNYGDISNLYNFPEEKSTKEEKYDNIATTVAFVIGFGIFYGIYTVVIKVWDFLFG